MPALREAPGLVHADILMATGLRDLAAQVLHEALDIALVRTLVTARADEDVRLVLAHQCTAAPASFSFRSAMNLSTSSRMAATICASGTFRMTSPPLKISPIPR